MFELWRDLADFVSVDAYEENSSMEALDGCVITIHGNKVEVVCPDKFTGEAKCNPDDKFDLNTGVAIALERADSKRKEEMKRMAEEKKIKVGDKVKVIDAGCNYRNFSTKVFDICRRNDLGDAVCRYAYDEYLVGSKEVNDIFRVLYIDNEYCYMENTKNKKCRLIRTRGIEKVM